jgi:hypothetical protein
MPSKKTSTTKTPAKKTSGKKSVAKTVEAATPAPEPEVVAAPDTVSTTTTAAPVEVSLLDQIESDFSSLN